MCALVDITMPLNSRLLKLCFNAINNTKNKKLFITMMFNTSTCNNTILNESPDILK